MTKSSSLLTNSAIFGLGIAVSKVVGLLMLPLYTRYLTQVDYGVLALLEFCGVNFGIVVGGGLTSALMRFYYEREDQHSRNVAFCSCLAAAGGIGIVCVGIGTVAVPIISKMVLPSEEFGPFLILIMVATAINVVNAICFTVLRVQERAKVFVGINICILVLSVILNVYFIAFLELGIMGFLLSAVIAATVTLGVFVIVVILPYRALPNRRITGEMVKFSFPFIPNGFISAFTHNLGVICLAMVGDIGGAGLYAVGRKLGSAVSLLASPIAMVWTPYMFKVSKQADAPRIYASGTTYLVTLMLFVVVGLVMVIKDAITVVAGPEFFDSYKAVFPVGLGALAFTLGPTLRIGIALAKKTSYLPLISGIATAFGFPLTYLLAKEFGMVGAAWGAASTWFLINLLTAVVSHRFLNVPYEFMRLIKIMAAASFCITILLVFVDSSLWFRIAIFACFPLLLLILQVPTADERSAAVRLISRALTILRREKATQS